MNEKKIYRLDAESALRERCLKMTADMMRILPQGRWEPLKFAGKLHDFVKGELKENTDKIKLDPYEDLL